MARVWCWTSSKWICNDEPIGKILKEAQGKFSSGWEYWDYGTGGDANGNGLRDAVCWYVVTDTLNRLGYHSTPQWDIMLLGVHWTKFHWEEYFCEIPLKDAGPGDIMNEPGHVEILESKKVDVSGGTPGWEVTGWGAQDYGDPPPNGIGSRTEPLEVDDYGYDSYGNLVLNVWRPKRKVLEIKCTEVGFLHYRHVSYLDPLVLDLNGDGIQTVGLSTGMHFDGDHNGLKEATGWVAPGDGMLMLDKNGNGLLDDGSELLYDGFPRGLPEFAP
jgi:hypothetical protein